ncbi:ABC transporter permease [Testudinibacter sp. TR-2022]|uniref:ABC transporter permease n=1 Tax=Testudinibacter sp. TR-2022 TaxID=2585029 RepID=UPI001118E3BA|nr:ABC transporter permease [Testudinibacter sp. TR-2022]TNH00305.1 ABC transporter permease [Pasteurellaceae bacterium Phil31]TNH09727.1 ABC transporter permease [Testudinibacter sp. TR-2022]TNH11108.1 ABC transporter permease [Testudinibacter sp. TR-2022]TNH13398.1 ABC transporter permease [Testudinibacter sp. TR-2022]TNH19496.1 ABC transporter permease [Testudinibacter sp. TR-2022]
MNNLKLSNRLLAKLAWLDLLYDRNVSFCIVASLVAVIAPLLLLFSLKYGVVSQLQQQLTNNPQNLEVKIVGNLNLKQAWFDWLKAQPETAFVIPLTRSLNTSADINISSNRFIKNVEILPTAEGDTLLGQLELKQENGVILSSLSAEKLQAKTGDKVRLVVSRKRNNIDENGIVALSVEGILPESRFARAAAFVQLPVLLAMEDYRDGYQTALFQDADAQGEWGRTQARESFARARIYAKSLDDVAPLAQKLRENNIETRTEANAIENVKAIDWVLNVIFGVIAFTSVLGCILSLIGAFLANIDRKRKEIALLRLLGFKPHSVVVYLIIQALLLSSAAFVISCCLFFFGSHAFNSVLGSHLSADIFISSLQLNHIGLAFAAALGMATIVAGIGGIRAVKIQPAESLRDV